MPIRYALQPDPLNASGRYHAHVIPARVLEVEDLIGRMAGAGSTLSRADLAAAMHLLDDTIAAVLSEGNHVNLPFCRLRPAIRGTFAGMDEPFDPSRQKVTVTAAAGTALKRRLRGTPVERRQGIRGVDRPVLTVLRDVTTDSGQGPVTPGGFADVHGRRLKFDPKGAGEGLFFVPLLPDGNPAPLPAVAAPVVALRTDQRLLFQIPALSPGTYRCLLRRRFGRQGALLREAQLPRLLTVAP